MVKELRAVRLTSVVESAKKHSSINAQVSEVITQTERITPFAAQVSRFDFTRFRSGTSFVELLTSVAAIGQSVKEKLPPNWLTQPITPAPMATSVSSWSLRSCQPSRRCVSLLPPGADLQTAASG